MPKKEVLKRMGQIYALAIQQGHTEEEVLSRLNKEFAFLYRGEKRKQYLGEE